MYLNCNMLGTNKVVVVVVVFEVSIASMSKEDRLCTEEIYTVGFGPSYDLPEARSLIHF